ncbi:VOC family protein [Novosphingobium guangzhouense]|uniref:Glyoxalase n=1 Tax=Novosphingobium guangzhouense TaxID=1850347 RepID=A0A2K2G3W8_9SPHN|nr:VOC family protein [Novosphingobium guangzhouense]PNU05739.1 glyoxalase [Novosphingobium guangzhouense]
MSIIDHIELPVADAEVSRRFYEAALEPLGLSLVITIDPARTAHGGARLGFGRKGYPSLWLHEEAGSSLPVHVAFSAGDRKAVDAFHNKALAHGGSDNGAPGVRERYHPTYYAAYVFDPDGNNIEAVCQTE